MARREGHPGPSAEEPEAGGTAVVLPGMAAAGFADLGRFLVLDRYVRARLPVVDEVLGESLLAGLRAADGRYGVHAQVAFMLASLALADRAGQEIGARPDAVVGPSFGHRALVAYCGALEFADAVALTVDIAECEAAYFAELPDDPITQCYLRVPEEPLLHRLTELAEGGEWVEVAGRLDQGAYLVSMRAGLREELTATVRQLGGYSMQSLRPAVHSARFRPLRERVEQTVLPRYPIVDPTLTVVADQDGRPVRDAAGLRTMLLDTFDRPLDWPAAIRGLTDLGVRHAYVTGPDQLFHRLDCTRAALTLTPVTPKTAARPRPSR